jgi:hypothetical protein
MTLKEKVVSALFIAWHCSVFTLDCMSQRSFEYSDVNSHDKNLHCCEEEYELFTKTNDHYKLFH